MKPGLAWLGMGLAVAAVSARLDDWRGVVLFAFVSTFIPEDWLWPHTQ